MQANHLPVAVIAAGAGAAVGRPGALNIEEARHALATKPPGHEPSGDSVEDVSTKAEDDGPRRREGRLAGQTRATRKDLHLGAAGGGSLDPGQGGRPCHRHRVHQHVVRRGHRHQQLDHRELARAEPFAPGRQRQGQQPQVNREGPPAGLNQLQSPASPWRDREGEEARRGLGPPWMMAKKAAPNRSEATRRMPSAEPEAQAAGLRGRRDQDRRAIVGRPTCAYAAIDEELSRPALMRSPRALPTSLCTLLSSVGIVRDRAACSRSGLL